MREKIENTLKAILKHVGQCGSCYGTEIGSRGEVLSIKNYQQAEQFASMIVQETDLMQKK